MSFWEYDSSIFKTWDHLIIYNAIVTSYNIMFTFFLMTFFYYLFFKNIDINKYETRDSLIFVKEILMTMVVLIVYVRWWLIGLHRVKSVCEFYYLDTRLWIAKIDYYSDKMLTLKSSIPLYNIGPLEKFPALPLPVPRVRVPKKLDLYSKIRPLFFKLKADILHSPMTDWFGQRIGTKLCLSYPKLFQNIRSTTWSYQYVACGMYLYLIIIILLSIYFCYLYLIIQYIYIYIYIF